MPFDDSAKNRAKKMSGDGGEKIISLARFAWLAMAGMWLVCEDMPQESNRITAKSIPLVQR
jgi:hypothetical protein